MKRILFTLVALAMVFGMTMPVHATSPTFFIDVTSISGGPGSAPPMYTNPISLAGTASATNYPGQIRQYQVQIDWGDGTVDTDSTFNYVVSGNNFSATWSSDPSHTYVTGGNKTILVKLYHQRPPGNEAGDSQCSVIIFVNNAPLAANDSYATDENVTLNVAAPGVLANDTDADSNPLTAEKVNDPSHGALTFNSDGSFNYVPDTDYYGSDSFTYKAHDGYLYSNVATVNITINAVNHEPVANDDLYSVDEDGTLTVTTPGVLSNDTDADSDVLTAVKVSNPSHGSLTSFNADGSFAYTPNANYCGSDSFTYKVYDGLLYSNVATVNITVNPVNDAPVAVNDAYSVSEDNSINQAAPGVLSNDTDIDGGTLTAVLDTDVSNGTLTLDSDGSFIYIPDTNYFGSDSFTYKAYDGTVNSNIATVTITVNAQNDAPVAVNDAYSVNEDNSINEAAPGVLANDDDVDNPSLTAVLGSGVSKGTLALNVDGSFTYAPSVNYFGSDSFTYRAYDGSLYSNVATVTITVNPVNDEPVAANDYYSVVEDNTLTVDAASGVLDNDTDVDGPALNAELVSDVSNGTLVFYSDGSFTYTPDADYNGEDFFTYQAYDGSLYSNVATVTITVYSENDAPVAADDEYSVDEDSTLSKPAPGVLFNDTDIDGDTLSAVLISDVSHGTLTLNGDGSFSYTPDADYNGDDSFTYKAFDGTAYSNIAATVTITVDPVNDAPEASDDAYSMNEDGTLNEAALSGVLSNDTDVDEDLLSAFLNSDVSHGTLTLNSDGSFSYTPDADYNGDDSFTYQAYDGTDYSNVATATITVNPVNDTPVAVGDEYSVNEDNTLIVAAPGVLDNDDDVDGDTLSTVLNSGVSHGTLTLNSDGSFTYTPAANYFGSDSFTYKAYDGTAYSDAVTVSITVNPVNDAPVALPDEYSVVEDGTLSVAAPGVLINDTDIEGDILTAALESGVSHGTLTLNSDGSFIYVPDSNYNGTDSFGYKAYDDDLYSNVVTGNVTITVVNDHPVAIDDETYTYEDTPETVYVLDNDYDDDGDTLTVVSVSDPANGTVTINAGASVTYTPDANYYGPDSFTYTISDGNGGTAGAIVYIYVEPVCDDPIALDDNATTAENTPVTINVLANDSDPDGYEVYIDGVGDPSHGYVTVNEDCTITYTPDEGYNGTDSFIYSISDCYWYEEYCEECLLTVYSYEWCCGYDTATVTITITPVEEPPPPSPYVVSIAVEPETASIIVGGKVQFTATATYSNASQIDVTWLAFWGSDASVATVDAGLATGVAVGTTDITATVAGITGTASLTVTTERPPVISVEVIPDSASIAVGQTATFIAIATYEGGAQEDVTDEASWGSSDGLVATVGVGSATGVGVGSTNITATFEGVISNPALLTVGPAVVEELEIVVEEDSSAPVGGTVQFTAIAHYSDGSTVDVTGDVDWGSSDAGVATIDDSGLATGVSEGSSLITATLGDASGSATITITAPVVVSIVVTPGDESVLVNKTLQYTATAVYSDGSSADVTAIANWASSDTDIATVDGGLATGKAAGEVDIIASLGDISSAPVDLAVVQGVPWSMIGWIIAAAIAAGLLFFFLLRRRGKKGGEEVEAA